MIQLFWGLTHQNSAPEYHIGKEVGEGGRYFVFAAAVEMVGRLEQIERFKFCLHLRNIKIKNTRTFELKYKHFLHFLNKNVLNS